MNENSQWYMPSGFQVCITPEEKLLACITCEYSMCIRRWRRAVLHRTERGHNAWMNALEGICSDFVTKCHIMTYCSKSYSGITDNKHKLSVVKLPVIIVNFATFLIIFCKKNINYICVLDTEFLYGLSMTVRDCHFQYN